MYSTVKCENEFNRPLFNLARYFSMSTDGFISKRENRKNMSLVKIMKNFKTSESLPAIV